MGERPGTVDDWIQLALGPEWGTERDTFALEGPEGWRPPELAGGPSERMSHEQLRDWGSAMFRGRDGLGRAEIRIPAKVFFAMDTFPSDFFPLRILCSLWAIFERVLRHNRSIADGGDRARGARKASILLMARRTVCVYQAMLAAGLELPAELRERIFTDRFIYLTDMQGLRDEVTVLVDDLAQGGHLMDRRSLNLKSHVDGVQVVCVPLVDARAEPRNGAGQQSSALVVEDVRQLAWIKKEWQNKDVEGARRFACDARDGTELYRGFSRLFARNDVPYFTDFPTSKAFFCSAPELDAIFNYLGPWVEVSNAASYPDGSRQFTFDASHKLEGDGRFHSVTQLSTVVKVRLFCRDTGVAGRRRFALRLLVKPMLAELKAREMLEWAVEVGAVNLDSSEATVHQLNQLFGLIEYACAKQVLTALLEKLWQETGVEEIGLDEENARLVLGETLYNRLGEWEGRVADEKLRSAVYLPPDVKPYQEAVAGKEGFFGAVLGDDGVEAIERYVAKYTKEMREKVEDQLDYLRLSLLDLVAAQRRDRERLEKVLSESGRARVWPLGEWRVSLALDLLTDWGMLVPDQQTVTVSGERKDSVAIRVFDRLERLASRLRHADRLKEVVVVHRCFRTGELTAFPEHVALSGGKLSASSTSFIYREGSSEPVRWELDARNPGRGKGRRVGSAQLRKGDCLV